MATKKAHIKACLDFVRNHNLHHIIRNTGHDFMGRSARWGSLAMNTYSFKDVKFVKRWTGPGGWRGGVVTVGAGIQGRELFKKCLEQSPKLVVLVDYAGGYIQGGGQCPLATLHGMAADQAPSFNILTAKGEFLTANADSNPSLFWALKGGDPATFGIPLSVNVNIFPEIPVAGIPST